MNKADKFALAMSTLLFEMRIESGMFGEDLATDQGLEVPQDYAIKIVDNTKHAKAIKELIRLSVLFDCTDNPTNYKVNEDGDFMYTTDVYDHSCLVDTYIENQYASMQTKIVHVIK